MQKVKHITLSFTVLNEWRRCPRKFYYTYVKGLRPISVKPTEVDDAPIRKGEVRGSPLIFGKHIHRFLELYHSGEQAVHQLVYNEALQENALPVTGLRSQTHLKGLMEAYVNHYPRYDSDLIIHRIDGKLAVELELEIPITDRISFRMHFDGLCQDALGNLKILEHKTSSKHLAHEWMNRMLPNAQAVGYVYAAQQQGHSVNSVLFNGLSTDPKLLDSTYFPKTRSGEIKERPPLFMRHEIFIEQYMLDEWLESIKVDAQRIIEDIESDRYTQNAPDACTVFNQVCPFRQICLAYPDARPELMDTAYSQETWKGFEIIFE